MRKLFAKTVAVALSLTLLTGCGAKDSSNGSTSSDSKVIKVGASPSPHAEILNKAAEILKDKGYDLQVVEYVDYIQPNIALDNGDLDANYFQHQPYLDQFNEENGTDLVSVGTIHYEPFGIYAGKTDSIDNLKEGAQIAVPNDGTNEARALFLLEAQGLIKLKEGVDLTATKNDIVENPLKLDIIEVAAAQLPRSLSDVDLAVINGNYAIEAGLNVATDAIATEDAESIGASTYGNVLVVKAGNENNEAIQALLTVLQSDEIATFITDTFEGAVVPLN
ncbi:MAG: ABC transporter substrate-binding protein [Lachnospiraceae bacterium]|nr:ABC transporter substrate-binding protein [Lachnospiraceae bacterium]